MNNQPNGNNPPNQPGMPGIYQQTTPPASFRSGFFRQTVPLWLFLTTIITLIAIIAFLAGRSISTNPTTTKASTTIQPNSSSGGTTDNTGGNVGPTPAQVTVTSATKWKTVQSYSNTGNLKTGQFTITGPWQLVASCTPNYGEFNFWVDIDTPDGHFFDGGINYICSSGDTSESYVEYYGGTFYLDIVGSDSWTLNVQEVDQ